MHTVVIQKISSQQTWAVRHPVLRKGRPVKDCIFKHDDDKSTLHFGAYQAMILVGVVTLIVNSNGDFQLRGMAVLEPYQKFGIGAQLVRHLEDHVRKFYRERIWMNAREIAVPFYLKLGYVISGKPFDIPGIGAHYVMEKVLS